MKIFNKTALSFFSATATIQFVSIFIDRVYGIGRILTRYGPCNLNEIPWLDEIKTSIFVGLAGGLVGYLLDKAEKEQGKETVIPRMRFKHFATAILFFSVLLFGFIFIFVIREYNEYTTQVTYMFVKTFWQYCSAQIPWLEIVATSLLFGVILALGFCTTKQDNTTETEGQISKNNVT